MRKMFMEEKQDIINIFTSKSKTKIFCNNVDELSVLTEPVLLLLESIAKVPLTKLGARLGSAMEIVQSHLFVLVDRKPLI